MYTFLINADNTLTASVRHAIMHRSTGVDNIHFLCDQMYVSGADIYDMTDFTCILEYVSPISKEYHVEVLTLSPELYKEKLEYLLPVKTAITKEFGNVELKLTFTYASMDDEGVITEHVRKTTSAVLPIIEVQKWSDYVSSTDLDAVAKIMLALQTKIEQESAYAEIINATKADNLVLDEETKELYLTADGNAIGDRIDLNDLGDNLAEATEAGLIRVMI